METKVARDVRGHSSAQKEPLGATQDDSDHAASVLPNLNKKIV